MIQSLPISIALFIIAAVVIASVGIKMSKISDRQSEPIPVRHRYDQNPVNFLKSS